MFRAFIEPACHGYGLSDGYVAPHVIFPGAPNRPTRDEIRFLEILQDKIDDRVVQDSCISCFEQFSYFRYRFSCYMQVAQAAKGNEPIRVNSHRLVEIGRERKGQ